MSESMLAVGHQSIDPFIQQSISLLAEGEFQIAHSLVIRSCQLPVVSGGRRGVHYGSRSIVLVKYNSMMAISSAE